MIVEGSQAWGGFTLRVIRDRMQAQERLQYDEYTGILGYNELDNIVSSPGASVPAAKGAAPSAPWWAVWRKRSR
jgi:hypothetical protein